MGRYFCLDFYWPLAEPLAGAYETLRLMEPSTTGLAFWINSSHQCSFESPWAQASTIEGWGMHPPKFTVGDGYITTPNTDG